MSVVNIRKAIKEELGLDVPKRRAPTNEEILEGMYYLHEEYKGLMKHVNAKLANTHALADAVKDHLKLITDIREEMFKYVGDTYNSNCYELKRLADEAFRLTESLTHTLEDFKASGLPIPRELREKVADQVNEAYP